MKINRILVPLDLSERSLSAIEHGKALSERLSSELILAHIVPPSPYEYAAFDGGFYVGGNWPDLAAVETAVESRMSTLLAQAETGAQVTRVIRRGDPAAQIEALVQEYEVGLVVMPTHGYGVFRRFVLGSVTAKVLHDLEVPVFTGVHVPEISTIDPEPYKRIACAVDLHQHSKQTLAWAWELSKACADDLLIIHAAPQIDVGGSYGDWFPAETKEQVIAHSRATVMELMKEVGCRGQLVVDSADAVSFIRQAVDQNFADLLVIGRSPHHGVLTGIRSHASALIREAPCPVISV